VTEERGVVQEAHERGANTHSRRGITYPGKRPKEGADFSSAAMTMFSMCNEQYQIVYDALSFSLACMMSCTLFLWMRVPSIVEKYKSAVLISGLVTFIAAYHYIRIFNSWVDSYYYPPGGQLYPQEGVILEKGKDGKEVEVEHTYYRYLYGAHGVDAQPGHPRLTGTPFNDAYRYMDWLLTVPLLLIEIILVMKLPKEEANSKCWSLGTFSALMILSGYKGELILTGDFTMRWVSWLISMSFFMYIVQTLLVGLSEATNSEEDPAVKELIRAAQVWTVISWCTYPIVYVFPMMGISGPSSVVAIQLGYSCSDIISKCGVGLLIYQITNKKSQNERVALDKQIEDAQKLINNAAVSM